MKKISIIISVYNEAKSLPDFAVSLKEELAKLEEYSFEALWINDGSKDDSLKILKQLKVEEQSTSISHKIINFSKNFGHEAAMIAGIDYASGNACICMDADGQHPPSEINKMIAEFRNGSDIILMERLKREDHSKFKHLLSSGFYKLMNSLSNVKLKSNSSDFFLVSDAVAEILRENYRERNRFLRGYIQQVGFNVKSLSFKAPKRMHGESSYSLSRLFKLALNAVFTLSNKPLRISIVVSILFILFTLVIGLYTLFMYFFQNKVPEGYTTIVIFLSVSFSLLFSVITILAVYFEKVISEIRQRPIYLVKEVS